MPKPDRLSIPCPRCNAGIGAKCRNYLNKPCAPHRERKVVHVPNVQPVEVIAERVKVREEIAGGHAEKLTLAIAKCGYFPDASYGVWTFRDRTGQEPNVMVFRCYRPGGDRRGPDATGNPEYHELFPRHDEKLGPPWQAYFNALKPDEPGGFGYRWESSWSSIEVPRVQSPEKLHAAAVKRREKVLSTIAAEAEALEQWKQRNETPSLFAEEE